jgi:hypothetical protein
MLENAGFEDITLSPNALYWCAVAARRNFNMDKLLGGYGHNYLLPACDLPL